MILGRIGEKWEAYSVSCEGKTDEFCTKNEELCIKNEELCISNADFFADWHNLFNTNPDWAFPEAATNNSRSFPRVTTSYTSLVSTGCDDNMNFV